MFHVVGLNCKEWYSFKKHEYEAKMVLNGTLSLLIDNELGEGTF